MSEFDRLQEEIAKIDAQVEALSPKRRAEGASAIRAGLVQRGVTVTAEDDRVLNEFAAGRLQLDELALQFHGRI